MFLGGTRPLAPETVQMRNSRSKQSKSLIDTHSQLLQMVRMIICVCNRINCRSVREAVDAGARSPKAVQAHHGCKFNCGKCSTTIGEMIAEKMDAQGPSMPMMAAE